MSSPDYAAQRSLEASSGGSYDVTRAAATLSDRWRSVRRFENQIVRGIERIRLDRSCSHRQRAHDLRRQVARQGEAASPRASNHFFFFFFDVPNEIAGQALPSQQPTPAPARTEPDEELAPSESDEHR